MGDTTPTYDIFELFGDWRGRRSGSWISMRSSRVWNSLIIRMAGKPVIVGGLPEERGVVSTASYEARPFGVHSAMPSAQAMRLCPHAIWTHGHFDRYREMSAKVMAILADETPYVDQVSIDEAFFDITPGRFSRETP